MRYHPAKMGVAPWADASALTLFNSPESPIVRLHSDHATIVFLGSFNPRLFHPTWMEANGVLTSKEAELALAVKPDKSDLEPPGSPARLVVSEEVAQIIVGGLQITVQTSKLSITATTQDLHTRPIEIAAALQSHLPHTPVLAIGLNRNFVLDVETLSAWHNIGNTVLPKEGFWSLNGQDPGTVTSAVRYRTCAVARAQLNLVVGPAMESQDPFVRVNCNYHFDEQAEGDASDSPPASTGPSGRKSGLRLADFRSVLTEARWNEVYADALQIAERVSALGTPK